MEQLIESEEISKNKYVDELSDQFDIKIREMDKELSSTIQQKNLCSSVYETGITVNKECGDGQVLVPGMKALESMNEEIKSQKNDSLSVRSSVFSSFLHPRGGGDSPSFLVFPKAKVASKKSLAVLDNKSCVQHADKKQVNKKKANASISYPPIELKLNTAALRERKRAPVDDKNKAAENAAMKVTKNLKEKENLECTSGLTTSIKLENDKDSVSWDQNAFFQENLSFSSDFWKYENYSNEKQYEEFELSSHHENFENCYCENMDFRDWSVETEDSELLNFYDNVSLTSLASVNGTTLNNIPEYNDEMTNYEENKERVLKSKNGTSKVYNFPRIRYTRNYLLQFSNCTLAYSLPDSLRRFMPTGELPLKQFELPKKETVTPITWNLYPNAGVNHVAFYKRIQLDVDTRRQASRMQY